MQLEKATGKTNVMFEVELAVSDLCLRQDVVLYNKMSIVLLASMVLWVNDD